METPQNSTPAQTPSDTPREPSGTLDAAQLTRVQRAFIDYKACNGLIFPGPDDYERKDKDGNVLPLMPIRRTVQWLADQLGVERTTLYKAKAAMGAQFWVEVNKRRKEIGSEERLAKMHEVWYLSALNPKNFQDRQLWLANFDNDFRMPSQKVEVEAGNSWSALLEKHANAIDTTVSDTPATPPPIPPHPPRPEPQEAVIVTPTPTEQHAVTTDNAGTV